MYSERQREMLRYLSEVKFAKVEQLSDLFHVSIETIRRDLLELEKDSSVKRIRGGATYSSFRAKELEFSKKMESNQQEKLAIAQAAAEYINDGDAIAMNNGSTTLSLARYLLKSRKMLTVVTNSPDIALILSDNESNQIYLTSGYLRKHNKTEYNTEEAAVLRKMLEIGHSKIILCEFNKFSEVAFNKVCSAEQVDYVFTDWNMPAKEIKAWNDIGVKVLVSPQEKYA